MATSVSILLVEDNPADVELAKAHLVAAGFDLDSEGTVEAAAQRLRRHRFDLVLVDLSLPDSQGLASFKLIHALAHEAPVIVLTDQDDTALAARAVVEGAKDYLFKSRIQQGTLVGSIRSAVARSHRQHTESELSAAAKIQRQLFVDETPQLTGFDIYSRSSPSAFAHGDFLDFVSLGTDRLAIVIADVVARGFAQGIIMCETRSAIRALATMCDDVGEILTQANTVLASDLSEETFVALFLASIDGPTQTIRFAAAGHSGFVLNQAGRARQLLKSDDPPLGLCGATQFHTSPDIPLHHGEGLLLMTDGLADGVGRDRSRFGKKQVFDTIRLRYRDGPRPALDHVFDHIHELAPTRGDADVTAVLVKAQPGASPAPAPETTAESVIFCESYRYFDVESLEDPVVLCLRESEILSAESVNGLREELLDYVSRSASNQLTIRFKNVRKFTSEAINVCLTVKQALDARGASLRLCDMRPYIRDAFRSLNLDGTVFEIVDQAADSLSASSEQNRDTPAN